MTAHPDTRRRDRGRRAAIAAAVGLLVLSSWSGCGTSERASDHAAAADEHLAAGRLEQALIELSSAQKEAPNEPEYPERMARVLLAKGDLAEARFYLGEAYRLDPSRESAAVALAQLLLGDQPEQAEALIAELLERDPDSAWAHIGLSEQALVEFELEVALELAERAAELDPDLPDAHWQVARALQASIREHQLEDRHAPSALFRQTIEAIDRFAATAEHDRWREKSERARVLAAWPGRTEEAKAAIREASEELGALGRVGSEYEVLDLAIELARATTDLELEQWALERKVELVPTNYPAWEELAALSERQGVPSRTVYLRMAEALPGETEPQIRFARRIQRVVRPMKAVGYLRGLLPGGEYDEPAILAEIARIQLGAGRLEAALDTVAELERAHPEARETKLMLAWALTQTGRPQQAIELLAQEDWANEHVGAQRLMSDAHVALGDPAAALETVERAIALMPHPDAAIQRARARLLLETGRALDARRAIRDLSRTTALRAPDMTLLARAYVETNGPGIGVRLLERLVDAPDPYEPAVYELFMVAGRSPEQRDRLRGAFERILERAPNHPGVLDAWTRLEIDAGTPDRARPAVARSREFAEKTDAPTGRLDLLLARIDGAAGRTSEARDRVLAILEQEPTVTGLLDFATALYPTQEDAVAGIDDLVGEDRRAERPASHHALLARLYFRSGNEVLARWELEQALNGGIDLPILKNDLAYLLAKQRRDLKRAEVLARQAIQAIPDEPGVIDTLGYVLLQSEEYDRASKQFRRALEVAEQTGRPRATIEFHLGVALTKLERFVEAEQAFERALALGEPFEDEDAARRRLKELRGEA